MKILLLGASGRTGRLILNEALNQGMEVHAIFRSPENAEIRPGLTVFKGTPEDLPLVLEAARGCNAAISALNLSRKSDWPWARQITPRGFMVKSVQNVLEAMNQHQFSRIVVISAAGVGDSLAQMPGIFRWLIRNSNIGNAYAEHADQELLLRNSNTDFTILRPVGLTNKPARGKAIVSTGGNPAPSGTISRQQLAKLAIQCAAGQEYLRQWPTVSER